MKDFPAFFTRHIFAAQKASIADPPYYRDHASDTLTGLAYAGKKMDGKNMKDVSASFTAHIFADQKASIADPPYYRDCASDTLTGLA